MKPSPPGVRAILVLALLLWAWVSVPTLLGQRTFYLRDVFLTHLPFKAFGAEQLREGRIPALNPTWGLGQAFRGNPNALAFYPGNLAYLALPFWSAFNLHYALHWLIAFLTMRALAHGLGLGRAGALMAALSWAGSGWMLSALTFYNSLTVAAWWPLVLLGAVRGGRSGIALGGLACGLALLGGEPVLAALGLVPLLALAVQSHGGRKGLGTAVAIGTVGLLVALPQVVATARILPFTFRGSQGVSAEQAADYTLHPLRLLELVFPFPFGLPNFVGSQGIWTSSILPGIPLCLTLYCGVVALWLAASAMRRHRLWAWLAAAGLVLAIAAGSWGELLVTASFGLFRFPEKFLFWYALALPLLAGWGLERALAGDLGDFRKWRRLAIVAGGLALVLAVAVLAAGPVLVRGVSGQLANAPEEQRNAALDVLSTQVAAWALGWAIAGAALLLAFLATGGRVQGKPWQPALLLGLQLATLLQLRPLVHTDSTAPYRDPSPWARRLGPGTAVVHEGQLFPTWIKDPPYRVPGGPRAVLEQVTALDLDFAPGILHGLTYPLVPDLEGMQTPLFPPMLHAMAELGWDGRVRWMRSVGLQAAVLFEDPHTPGLRLLDQVERYGVDTRLYAVVAPAPKVWWPRELIPAPMPADAVRVVSTLPDPVAVVAAPPFAGIVHDPAGRVRLLAEEPDRIEVEVEGRGGIAVVRRAFHPLYEARADGQRLRTLPVNLNLLGLAVPPGKHRVVLDVSAGPEIAASVIGLVAVAAALGVLWRGRPLRSLQ